jgi:hypothetical protein
VGFRQKCVKEHGRRVKDKRFMRDWMVVTGVASLLVACGSENDPRACPDGTFPDDDGEVTFDVHGSADTPEPLDGVIDAAEVQVTMSGHCVGLLPQDQVCRRYLVVQASEKKCASRTIELRFQFSDAEPDGSAALTNELADVQYRRPFGDGSEWATWFGGGPVTIEEGESERSFTVSFTDMPFTRAPTVLTNHATGTFLASGRISGGVH